MKLLTVCTANICRSPSIEAAVRTIAREREVDISLLSAGTRAVNGHPADPDTVTAAKALGLDLSGHSSQRLTAPLVNEADLILCAEFDHLAKVLDFDPNALPRTYLLLEFVDKVSIRHEGDDVTAWLDRCGRHRTAERVLDESRRYKLSDPHKRGKKKQAEIMTLVVECADRVVEAWAG